MCTAELNLIADSVVNGHLTNGDLCMGNLDTSIIK